MSMEKIWLKFYYMGLMPEEISHFETKDISYEVLLVLENLSADYLQYKSFFHREYLIAFALPEMLILYNEEDYIRSGYKEIAQRYPELPKAQEELWMHFIEGKPAIDLFLKNHNLVASAASAPAIIDNGAPPPKRGLISIK